MAVDIILFDRASWRDHLLPLVYTRPVGDLHIGILSLAEKWGKIFNCKSSYYTEPYLAARFPTLITTAQVIVLKANICPSDPLITAIDQLREGEILYDKEEWLAFRIRSADIDNILTNAYFNSLRPVNFLYDISYIRYPEDIFRYNSAQLQFDYALLTRGRSSESLSGTNQLIGDRIFIEDGVFAECCSFNTTEGPIYLAKGVEISEGSHLRGNVAIGQQARVKMGTRIYGNVSIGAKSTAGGELGTLVMGTYSAKGHDGYLGCAVIGNGCNLGAGTNNSNLKNNWKPVSIYDYALDNSRNTGLRKCGLIMGDYAMSGINTSFNTGTVVGVGVQYARPGYSPKFIPDFSWCTDQHTEEYRWDKFEEMLRDMKVMKAQPYHDDETELLRHVYKLTQHNRLKYQF